MQFTRYRGDNSVIGSFRSLWIVTEASCSSIKSGASSRSRPPCRFAAFRAAVV